MRLICIPALKKHKIYVDYSIKQLLRYCPNDKILIVTPHIKAFDDLKNDMIQILEDSDFFDLSPIEIEKHLVVNKKPFHKWYYQQFLKYSIVSKNKNFSEILILDADTIILSEKISDCTSIYLNTIEYHKPYFNIIAKYFPEHKILPRSSIVNYMWFNSQLLNDMLKSIEFTGKNKWYLVLLNEINQRPDFLAFSEYETYANYKFNKFKSSLKTLKIFRRADLFVDYYSFEKVIKVSKIFKFDLIAFEDNHKKSFYKKIIIFIIMIFIEMRIRLSKEYKNL
jgi:hypothetical protein